MARELSASGPGPGWRLTVGSAAAAEQVEADAVILAIPARPAGSARRSAGRGGGRHRLRRDQLREHGHRHAGLPALRVPRTRPGRPGLERVPGPRGGRAGGEGGHLLYGQVAAPGQRGARC